VYLNDVTLLSEQIGATPPAGSEDSKAAKGYAQALFMAGLGHVPTISGLGMYAEQRWELRGYLGFHAGNVSQTAWTGVLPDVTSMLLGSFDPAATQSGIDGCGVCAPIEEREHHGVRYFTHGGDLEVSAALRYAPPGFDELGRFGRLAVQQQQVTHTLSTAAMEAAIDAGLGRHPSLADDDAFRLLTTGAAAMGAHGVILSDDTAPNASTRPSEERDNLVRGREHLLPLAVDPALLLRPYDVVMLGGGRADGRPYLIVGLVHASEEAARANVEILPRRVAQVVEFEREQPWRDLVRVTDIHAAGRLLLARLDTLDAGHPRLWINLWDRRENLLYFGD